MKSNYLICEDCKRLVRLPKKQLEAYWIKLLKLHTFNADGIPYCQNLQ